MSLASTDFEAAKGFYSDLLGWDWQAAGPAEETGGYGFFTFKGKQVAGGGPVQGAGQPSAWSSYITVADVDEASAKIKEAGGAVMAEFELPNDSGRIAVCQDTEGAFFSTFKPNQHRGAEFVNEIGAWTWNQLVTRDLDKGKEFYGKVFGWELTQADEAPPDLPFFMWQVQGQKWEEGLGGAMDAGDQLPPEIRPHWQVYFCVSSAEEAVKKVSAAGGTVVNPPVEAPVGKFAVFTDPQGAAFGIVEPDYPEPR